MPRKHVGQGVWILPCRCASAQCIMRYFLLAACKSFRHCLSSQNTDVLSFLAPDAPAWNTPTHWLTVCMQVLTMVTLSFTFAGALAGLMGMNLYFAVAATPLVSSNRDPQHHFDSSIHGATAYSWLSRSWLKTQLLRNLHV